MPIGSWMIFILLSWFSVPSPLNQCALRQHQQPVTTLFADIFQYWWKICLFVCTYFSVAIIPDRCNIFMAIYWWQFTGGNHPRSVHCDILTQLCFSPSIRGEAKPPLIQMINSWQQNIKYCADLRLFSTDQGFGAGVCEKLVFAKNANKNTNTDEDTNALSDVWRGPHCGPQTDTPVWHIESATATHCWDACGHHWQLVCTCILLCVSIWIYIFLCKI